MRPGQTLSALCVSAVLLSAGASAFGQSQSPRDRVTALTANWIPAKNHDFRKYSNPRIFVRYAGVEEPLPVEETLSGLSAREGLGKKLVATLRQGRGQGQKPPAVILDCGGPMSVALAVELGKAGYQPVSLLNGAVGKGGGLQSGSVRTLAALAGLRAEVERSGDMSSPPAFILDRSRLEPGAAPEAFILPGAPEFLDKGVPEVLYIHDADAEGEKAWAPDIAGRLKALRPNLQVRTLRLSDLR
ncbi:MAG: hypothetical protein WC943_07290 [Elusimicrobiota bacterium]|jgi:hypothetical protein